MKLAIHNSKTGFHPRWIKYCEVNNIPYKLVDCYDTNIIENLKNCSALMWHHNQANAKDILLAKNLLFALEQSGMSIFPNFNTAWHFDDKVGQKYLLEAIGAPLVPSFAFYSKETALEWANQTQFPKVFKLRGGAGSANVKLARTKGAAIKLIKKAFNRGFRQYEPLSNLKERYRKYKQGNTNLWDVIKGCIRIFYEPKYSKVNGNELGYIYFQEFIPNNDCDIRIIAIDGKAFALKRMVREGDFRASGSGDFKVAKEEFDERCVKIAFETNKKLNVQGLAYDFIFDENNNPLIVEVSFGFVKEVYDPCPGYWDENVIWHEGEFVPQNWMVESLIEKQINE